MVVLSLCLAAEMAWTTYLARMYGSFSLHLPILPWMYIYSNEDSIILMYFDC